MNLSAGGKRMTELGAAKVELLQQQLEELKYEGGE